MTTDTYSLELEKSVLAISIVMVKVDWGSREEKTASHAGAVESDDLQSMVVPEVTSVLYEPAGQQL